MAEGEGNGTVNVEDVEKYADGGDVDSLDSIKAEAMELAGDPEKLGAVLKTMIADYGREFVVGAVALAAPLIDAKAEGYAKTTSTAISKASFRRSSNRSHRCTAARFPMLTKISRKSSRVKHSRNGSPAWTSRSTCREAEQVVESGSAGQIVKLMGQFKDLSPRRTSRRRRPRGHLGRGRRKLHSQLFPAQAADSCAGLRRRRIQARF